MLTRVEPCSPTPDPPPQGAAASVLVVEDNVVNQRVVKSLLEKLGCKVVVAGDGLQGVNTFKSGTYDLVLMDCQMPVLDGFGATGKIREAETAAAKHTPIIAVTANALEGDRERCLASGMDDFLPKPIRLNDLRELLARWGIATSNQQA